MLILDIQSHDSLNKAKARLKAAGLPLSYEEFHKLYGTPVAAGNRKEFKRLENPKPDGFEIDNFSRFMTPENWTELEDVETLIDKIVKIARSIPANEKWVTPLPPNQIPEMITDEIISVRSLTTSVLIKAMLEFHRANRIEALRLVKLAFRMSQLNIENPNFFFNFTDAEESSCLKILRLILVPGNVTAAEAKIIEEIRSEMRQAKPLRFYIATEPIRGALSYEAYRRSNFSTTPQGVSWQTVVFTKLINTSVGRSGEAELLNLLAESVELESKPGTTLLDLYKVQKKIKSTVNSPGLFAFSTHFNSRVYNSPETAVRGLMNHQAHLDILDACLGRKTGNDPFTNRPYLTLKQPKELIKYSVGPDFVDNKGDIAKDIALPVLSSIMKPGS